MHVKKRETSAKHEGGNGQSNGVRGKFHRSLLYEIENTKNTRTPTASLDALGRGSQRLGRSRGLASDDATGRGANGGSGHGGRAGEASERGHYGIWLGGERKERKKEEDFFSGSEARRRKTTTTTKKKGRKKTLTSFFFF